MFTKTAACPTDELRCSSTNEFTRHDAAQAAIKKQQLLITNLMFYAYKSQFRRPQAVGMGMGFDQGLPTSSLLDLPMGVSNGHMGHEMSSSLFGL